MNAQLRLIVVLAAFSSISCTVLAARRATPPDAGSRNDNAARMAVLARAQLWQPTTIRSMNVIAGPQRPGSFPPPGDRGLRISRQDAERPVAEVRVPAWRRRRAQGEIRRHQRRGLRRGAGHAAAVGARIRRRRDVSGERDLPWLPAASLAASRGRATNTASILPLWSGRCRATSGRLPATAAGPGRRCCRRCRRAGGAPRSHRDALALLAVMIQHTDTKRQQQRLLCLGGVSGSGSCSRPFFMVSDVGLTFGARHPRQQQRA